jgi:hypothetical protein
MELDENLNLQLDKQEQKILFNMLDCLTDGISDRNSLYAAIYDFIDNKIKTAFNEGAKFNNDR